jgi:hypothetical protein
MKSYNLQYSTFDTLKEFVKKNNIASNPNILLQIFTGVCEVDFIEKLINEIKTLIPHIKIIGSTTSGEILEGMVFYNSTILSFSIFEKTQIETYNALFDEDSYKMGKSLIEKFDKNKKAKLAISFTDGLNVNAEEYIKSFNDFDKELVIAGGLAGDNNTFTQTIVFTEKSVRNNGAVVAIFYNEDLIVHTKASFGWENIGKTMTITKVHKNRVYEIDGVKAFDIYAKYLGKDIAKLLPKTGIEFPLIVKRGSLNIPRAVIGKKSDGSLVFAGNFKKGDKVTFGYGNLESILNYSDTIANDNAFLYSEAIFIYSCMARLALMKESIVEEMQALAQFAPLSGFFTYGEFFTQEDTPQKKELLNQTMTIVSISESKQKKNRITSIDKKTLESNLTLKALSNLIAQTSKELEETNRSLEKRVASEVKKNLDKKRLLKRQSRLAQMGEMLSMIAHQWRQPLSAISSTILAIQVKVHKNRFDFNKKEECEKFLEFLEEKHNDIYFYLESLSETIDDFRNFFKAEKDKDKVALSEPINKALSIIRNAILSKGITLKVTYGCEDEIYMYRNEMMQVILNILKNAKDNFKEKKIKNPTIYIRTMKKDEKYIIEICDNGGGIKAKHLPKIFDPYFSTKDDKNGTGLGLYISKIIVEKHNGGKLKVKNTNDGVCFTLELYS